MAEKKHSPEQIVALLRQIEVAIANGKLTPQACREAGIKEQSYYRWRKEYGGLKPEHARRLKVRAGEREQSSAETGDGVVAGEAGLEGRGLGKLLSPERRRCAVEHAHQQYRFSQRHACRLLGQWEGRSVIFRRSTTTRMPHPGHPAVTPSWSSISQIVQMLEWLSAEAALLPTGSGSGLRVSGQLRPAKT